MVQSPKTNQRNIQTQATEAYIHSSGSKLSTPGREAVVKTPHIEKDAFIKGELRLGHQPPEALTWNLQGHNRAFPGCNTTDLVKFCQTECASIIPSHFKTFFCEFSHTY